MIFFRRNKPKDKIEIMETSSKIESSISEPILNYLKMNTTGALLISGNWGSGKTYHLKKYVFPLIESDTKYTPIMVSLYGETDKSTIARKVFFEYADAKGKKVKLNTATLVCM